LHSSPRAENGEVILNPSYELSFNFDGSQYLNRYSNEFYYRRELDLCRAITGNLEKKEIFQ